MKLSKYSFGIGDRFGHEGIAQLKAVSKAAKQGVEITPVWNKSHREHEIIGTSPGDVRAEADAAVSTLGWEQSYFVDADHITRDTVDGFLESSDFFTIDVADYIGTSADDQAIAAFLKHNEELVGDLKIQGIPDPFPVTPKLLEEIAHTFLAATQEAGRIHHHIRKAKGADVAVEVSMDEVDKPQTPVELFFILKCLAEEGLALRTIAPKFTGRFNKGVDYVGDLAQFAREFEQDVMVIDHATKMYDLPENLKLSVHSGSDKFSIYKPIHDIIQKHDAGIHLKTSGTTWLEELIGLSIASDDGVAMVHSIYETAWKRFEELTAPYAPVIDVQYESLPDPERFKGWDGGKIASILTHDPEHPRFDSQLRQFMHCAYKVAAEKGTDYTNLLKKHEKTIGENVTNNLYERHIVPLFLGN